MFPLAHYFHPGGYLESSGGGFIFLKVLFIILIDNDHQLTGMLIRLFVVNENLTGNFMFCPPASPDFPPATDWCHESACILYTTQDWRTSPDPSALD